MLIQISIFVIIFSSYLISRRYDNSKKVFLILSGILVTLLLGSRELYSGYADETMYYDVFSDLSKLSWEMFWVRHENTRDIGFYLTFWMLSKIIPWNQIAIYFITAIATFSFFRFIYYNSDDELISVLLLFTFTFNFYMSAYRQCFAMCFCLFAFEKAKKREPVLYVILMIIAISMHRSAIAFLPVYFLMEIKRDNLGFLACVASIVVLFLLRNYLIQVASEEVEKDYTSTLDFSIIGFAIQIIIMLVPFVLDGFMWSKWEEKSLTQFREKSILAIGITLYLFKFVAYAYERISYYYTFMVIIVFSNSISRLQVDKKTMMLIKTAICGLLVLLYFYRNLNYKLQFFWSV